MALLRIKSIEGIRFTTSGEMGKVLGLDRAPEVRTLRSKLDIISGHGNAENWQMSLSQDWKNRFKEKFFSVKEDEEKEGLSTS